MLVIKLLLLLDFMICMIVNIKRIMDAIVSMTRGTSSLPLWFLWAMHFLAFFFFVFHVMVLTINFHLFFWPF